MDYRCSHDNTSSALPPTTHREQISGTSIFWALASLALSTMIQPSFYGYVHSDNAFSTALSPHRSSPFVCLVDAGVDLWAIRRHLRRDRDQQPCDVDAGTTRESARPTAAIMQLALLAIDVLPPALKLFGTSGVSRSQLLAAVLFAFTLTSAARTLLIGVSSQRDLADITDALGARGDPDRRFAMTEEDLFLSVVCPHTFCILLAWSHIGAQIDLGVPEDISNILAYAGACAGCIMCAYAAQHTFFIVVRGQWILPRFPLLAITGATYLLLFYYEVSKFSTDRGADSWLSQQLLFAIFLLGHAALSSLALATLLQKSTQWLLGKFAKLPDSGIGITPRSQSRPSSTTTANGDEESRDASPLSTEVTYLDPADAGDIGLAALSQQPQHATASPTSPNASAETTPPTSNKPTRRHRLKTEAEAKRDFPRASRALHALVSPRTEDANWWEQHVAQCSEEGHNPYAGPAAPAGPFWRRLSFYLLFYVVLVVYRLGLTVYNTYNYFYNWVAFHLEPLCQGE